MFSVLGELKPKTEKRSEELSLLLGERYELNLRCQKFIDQEVTRMHGELLEEHERVKKLARAQQTTIAELEEKYGEYMRQWHTAKADVVKAMLELDSATAVQRGLGRFSTSGSIAAAKKRVESAQAAVDKAKEPESTALQLANHVSLVELPREKQKLEELATEELRLRARLNGLDPDMIEFGLRPVGA
jgi:hypothetical protein